jgi:hypothetical protein
VDRDGATDEPVKCRAVGYPRFAETPSPEAKRDTVDAIGMVPVLSKLATGMLSVQVSISPRPLPPEDKSLAESEWSGMSGAPVLAADRQVGTSATPWPSIPAGRAPSARRAASTRRRGGATIGRCSRADAAVVVVEDRYRRLGRE